MNKTKQNWLYSALNCLVLTKDGVGIPGPGEIKIDLILV